MESIGNNSKRIAKNTVFLYSRMIITTVIALFTVRIILKVLGDEDYGIYNAVGGIILSMTFISKVLALASQRFFAISIGKNDFDGLKKNLGSLLLVYGLLSLLVLITTETVGLWFLNTHMTIPVERLSQANISFQLSLAAFIITIIASPYQSLIISFERMQVFAYASIIDAILKLVLVFLLLINFAIDHLVFYSILMLASTLFSNAIYPFYCHLKFPDITKGLYINKSQVLSIVSYSSWTMVGTLSGVLSNQGIGILLNLFWGPIANAAFAIATQINNQINMLANNFFVAVRPAMIKNYAQNNQEYTFTLFSISSKIIFFLLYLVVLPLYIETKELLYLWLADVNDYLVPFVRQILILGMIVSLSYPITTIIQAAGYVKKYHIVVDGFTLISLPLAFLVAKCGCASEMTLYVFNIVFLAAHFIRLAILKEVVPHFSIGAYLKQIMLPILLVIASTFFISKYISTLLTNSISACLISIICCDVLIVIFSYAILLSASEKHIIIDLIKNRIRKRVA